VSAASTLYMYRPGVSAASNPSAAVKYDHSKQIEALISAAEEFGVTDRYCKALNCVASRLLSMSARDHSNHVKLVMVDCECRLMRWWSHSVNSMLPRVTTAVAAFTTLLCCLLPV